MIFCAVLSIGVCGQAEQPAKEAEFDLSTLPSGWHWSYVEEPIWQTQSFVVQAGLQHKQSILLVHGIGGSFTDWLDVIKFMAGQYHVIAVDLPGFGRSEEPLTQLSPQNYSKFLHWVSDEAARSPLVVIGHSMGAAISLQFAADYPDLVQRLVLVDTAGVLERTALLKENVNFPVVPKGTPSPISNFARKLNQFAKSLVEWTSTTPDPIPAISASDEAWRFLFEGRVNANAGLALIMHDFSSAIDSVEQPTWLIWGRNDTVAPLRTGRLLLGRLKQAELRVIDGAAHVPMKTHPKMFQMLLETALNSEPDLNKRFATSPVPASHTGNILYCRDQHGGRYSGHYKAVYIENCQGVTLVNLTANQIIMNRSQVSMVNVGVNNAGGTAIQSELSIVSMTNVDLQGLRGIESDGTRWDLAGVTVKSQENGVVIKRRSRFIFSVSKLKSGIASTGIHGVFESDNRVLDFIL
ncbi:hypothetical protein NBRC116494_18620 [Aurantivibrio plasticivorans]